MLNNDKYCLMMSNYTKTYAVPQKWGFVTEFLGILSKYLEGRLISISI